MNNESYEKNDNLLKTVFNDLDKIIVGLKNGELITIAGRPALGKSSLGISIINNVSKQTDKKILYFNLESPKDILSKRIIGDNIEIIDDIGNIEYIKIKCEEISKQGISLVVIDYFQLITTSNEYTNRLEEAFYISRILKTLALELDIPIIVLSQLSRSIEEREDKRPKLDDTRTTGLQQDSDKIICLYSDDYYNRKPLNKVEVIVVKNRGGNLGRIELTFNKDTLTFE